MPRKPQPKSWADEYEAPSDKQPLWQARDNVGELHLFLEPQRNVRDTQFGESEVADCAYVIVLSGSNAGAVYPSTAVFGNLGQTLIGYEGSTFALGVVAQGKAKPGRSAPFILEDPNEKQRAAAFKWMDEHLTRTPDGVKVLSADEAPF